MSTSEPPGYAEELVDVVLRDVGPRRAGVIELVRKRRMNINVKDTMKLVDSTPSTIFASMPRVQAEAIKIELEALGARLELTPGH